MLQSKKDAAAGREKRGNLFFGLALVLVVAGALVSSIWFYQLMLIQGRSMEPTYHNLQFAVIDKTVNVYQAGDVVAFSVPGMQGVLVKRIAAVPGDRARVTEGRLFVNGEASDLYADAEFAYAGILSEEVLLEDGQYLMIGDNIAESTDSRYEEIGLIPESRIIGRVFPNLQRR